MVIVMHQNYNVDCYCVLCNETILSYLWWSNMFPRLQGSIDEELNQYGFKSIAKGNEYLQRYSESSLTSRFKSALVT